MLYRAGVVIAIFIVFLSSVSFAQTTLEGDVNQDKKVDYQDLMILIKGWHEETQPEISPTETSFVTPTPTFTPFPTPTSTTGEIITINLPGDVELKMVRIPAGSFLMGRYSGEKDSFAREDPQHTVNIGYDFYMGQTEVTKAQWEPVMGTIPWSGYSTVLDDPNCPAVYISWDDCQNFITEINKLGQGTFRLPSEAEWEYACRAGTTTRY